MISFGTRDDLGIFELFEEGFSGAREFFRKFNVEADVEVAVTGGVEVFDALAGEADDRAELGTGTDFDVEIFTGKSRNGDLATQNGSGEGNHLVDDDVVAFTLEDFMRMNFQGNIEVFEANAGAGIGAGGNLDGV